MERSVVTVFHSFCFTIFDTLRQLLASFSPSPTILVNNKRYKVIRKLGEGGFSYVFTVKDSTGQVYALKRIKIQLPEHEERLLNEIQAHRSVTSAHVIKLYDSQVVKRANAIEEGLLLLPLYVNGTVQDLINATRPAYIPLKKLLEISIDICLGLEAFHGKNPPLAFRDLKPANVLLDTESRAVLMDLGSVCPARVHISSRKDALQLQETCAETVTAPYRPPELFDPPSSGLVSESGDVWSLGCTMYAMAFHDPPFDGSLTATVSGKLPSRPSGEPYGEPWWTLIQDIIVIDSTKRPTVIQVRNRLERMLSSLETAFV